MILNRMLSAICAGEALSPSLQQKGVQKSVGCMRADELSSNAEKMRFTPNGLIRGKDQLEAHGTDCIPSEAPGPLLGGIVYGDQSEARCGRIYTVCVVQKYLEPPP